MRRAPQFTPKKAPETNRLTAGVLQLCTGTQLTVDETVLNEGRLESNGTDTANRLGARTARTDTSACRAAADARRHGDARAQA